MKLQSGKNLLLQTSTLFLNLDYPTFAGFSGEPDTCLFLLNEHGKVSSDPDFIFFNNLCSSEASLRLKRPAGRFQSLKEVALRRGIAAFFLSQREWKYRQ